MNTNKIRELFLNFFTKKNHIHLNESPLILKKDKSLLFTNSGMVQFKDIFLGQITTKYKNVVTTQRCIRVGGKHNDLNHIGISPHHNTSFEMLGNFSFMNYFKKEAIHLAWEFLTNKLHLDKKNLYVTIHKNDKETINIWKNEIKINNIIIGDKSTNFWSMDNTGPCGYCSEIFYDINTKNSKNKNLLEIWNLVFIQFNQNESNVLTKLNNYSIDTGAGLERLSSIMQNVFDNFEIDTIKPLIELTLNTLKIKKDFLTKIGTRIITDHIKTCIFLIQENILPSNEGRGYIIRKLIRRTLIHKYHLNVKTHLYKLISPFITILKQIYPHITYHADFITYIFKHEEEKFTHTLQHGLKFLKTILNNTNTINGKNLFLLYDTYGFPIDLITDITNNKNIKLNIIDFKKEMLTQQNKSKVHKNKTKEPTDFSWLNNIQKTEFIGYETLQLTSKIKFLIKNNKPTKILKNGEKGIIITNKTTFFSEKGGQTGDSGEIINNSNIFNVHTTKTHNNIHLHHGIITSGSLKINDDIITKVNEHSRQNISINHSATHLLHAVLIQILGKHIKQAGSLIKNTYLRFDFIHFKPLLKQELTKIEQTVNNHIRSNMNIITTTRKKNSDQNFLNEYTKEIRTITIGEHTSQELCAGTHVKQTSNIGLFKIIKEYGIGTSTRRIEAITGEHVINLINNNNYTINKLTYILKTNNLDIINKTQNLIIQNKNIKKENEKLQSTILKFNILQTKPFLSKHKIKIICTKTNKTNITLLKNTIIEYYNSIIILYTTIENSTNFTIYITNNLKSKFKAHDILDILKKNINCKGGGKQQIATGITTDHFDTNKISNYIHLYVDSL